MRTLVTLVILVALGGVGAYLYWKTGGPPPARYQTATVERGPLLAAINATGTIEPEELIDVGAQVAGRVERFGLDPRSQAAQEILRLSSLLPGVPVGRAVALALPIKFIDYGSPVYPGTVLAQLDPSLYQARVDQAEADLTRARADLTASEAKSLQTERDLERVQALVARRAASSAEHELARAAYDTARAGVDVAQAAIAQTEAALKEARSNLGYTTIRSPVRGVIIDTRVKVGQTVVASLNAPSMFLIAKDLKKLQVWAAVNEADIGQIRPGQLVYFTVDAHPGETFSGLVHQDQPRLNASMVQNVVTYTVVVNTDNAHGKLLPYLTANLQFVVAQKESTQLVPNAALRWRPRPEQILPSARDAYLKSGQGKRGGAQSADRRQAKATVWVPAGDGFVRPVEVRVGLSDGTHTEILDGDLPDGAVVVLREARQDEAIEANPFAPPSMFGGKKKQ